MRNVAPPWPEVTAGDERYPRPDLVRPYWTDLCGLWGFAEDPEDRGLRERWQDRSDPYDRSIVVPFPPESTLSGIADGEPKPIVWYRRSVHRDASLALSDSERLVLHFGAVDYRATVWVNGQRVGEHEGGHTPFSLDVSDALALHPDVLVVVVRAEDPPADADQPRGKQTSMRWAAGLFHERTTGIWQPVWLERRPQLALERLAWTPDVPAARIRLAVQLTAVPARPLVLGVTLRLGDEILAEQTLRLCAQSGELELTLEAAADGRQLARLLWSPEQPTLLDADVRLSECRRELDRVRSYTGLRSVEVFDSRFLLNGRVYPIRGVLGQGYWPDSHLAAPSSAALRREVSSRSWGSTRSASTRRSRTRASCTGVTASACSCGPRCPAPPGSRPPRSSG